MSKLQRFSGGVKPVLKLASVLALALSLLSLFMVLFPAREAAKAQADVPSISTPSLDHILQCGLWRVDGPLRVAQPA